MSIGDESPATQAVPVAELVGGRRRRRRASTRALADAHAASSARAGAPTPPVRVPLRHRVLPRSLLGLTSLILSFAIGAGLSGVVLYSYYQFKLNQTDDRVNALISGYSKAFANAENTLKSQTADDKAQIAQAIGPIQALEASPQTIAKLTRQLAPSVFYVHTLDGAGQPSVGTAFVISSTPTQSLLLCSYATIQATTTSPGPQVYVQQGSASTPVTVRSWDAANDLALILLPKGSLPTVPVAPASPAPAIGERLYGVSGEGSAGASLVQGLITDVASSGLQTSAQIGPAFQGGPLVNDSGQVVAVASRRYAPLGFTPDQVWSAPYVQAACAKVLSCPGGAIPASS